MKLVQYEQNLKANFNNIFKKVRNGISIDIGELNSLCFADALHRDVTKKRKLKIKRIK